MLKRRSSWKPIKFIWHRGQSLDHCLSFTLRKLEDRYLGRLSSDLKAHFQIDLIVQMEKTQFGSNPIQTGTNSKIAYFFLFSLIPFYKLSVSVCKSLKL